MTSLTAKKYSDHKRCGLPRLSTQVGAVRGHALLAAPAMRLGDMHVTGIKEISTWPVASADEPLLTVLHTTKNLLVGIDEYQVFVFQKSSTFWNGSGPFKRPTDEEIE